MADSKQKDVIDAALAALSGITDIGKVTQDEQTWADAGANLEDLPCLFVNAQKPQNGRAYFPHPTADDMEGTFDIQVHGQTLSEYGSTKRVDVDLVRKAIETTLDTDSTLQALILDIVLVAGTIDIGSTENRGFFLDQYSCSYEYNHATP